MQIDICSHEDRSRRVLVRPRIVAILRNVYLGLVIGAATFILTIFWGNNEDDSALRVIAAFVFFLLICRTIWWLVLPGLTRVEASGNCLIIRGGFKRSMVFQVEEIVEIEIEPGDGFPELSRFASFPVLRVSARSLGRRTFTRSLLISNKHIVEAERELGDWLESHNRRGVLDDSP